jgi:hypothetical protein
MFLKLCGDEVTLRPQTVCSSLDETDETVCSLAKSLQVVCVAQLEALPSLLQRGSRC